MARSSLPARFPPAGSWPLELRADLAAAFFDYADTRTFFTAVERGEAPMPTGLRGAGRKREPVWARSRCEHFVAQRHGLPQDGTADNDDIAELI